MGEENLVSAARNNIDPEPLPPLDRMDLGDIPVMRWDDPRVKRLFVAVFVLGTGFGSISTSLAFGFLFI